MRARVPIKAAATEALQVGQIEEEPVVIYSG